jgi:hypothetical protein
MISTMTAPLDDDETQSRGRAMDNTSPSKRRAKYNSTTTENKTERVVTRFTDPPHEIPS